MVKRMRKIAGCEDGTCPQMRETDLPGMVAVRGRGLSRKGRLWRRERDVLIPASLLDQAAQARGWRRP